MKKLKSPLFSFKALIIFLISLIGMVLIMETQLLLKYIEDIAGNNLSFKIITELIVYSSSSVLLLALPISMAISSALIFHRNNIFREKKANMLILILICILIWFFAAFAHANVDTKFRALLYDIRNKTPEEELVRSEAYLFEEYAFNVKDLYQRNDSLKIISQEIKTEIINYLKNDPAMNTLNISPDKINLHTLGECIESINTYTNPSTELLQLKNAIAARSVKLDYIDSQIEKNRNKIQNINVLPVLTFLLFILGGQVGYMFKKIRAIYVFIITFFGFSFFWIFLNQFIKKMVLDQTFSNFTGNCIAALIVLSICILMTVLNKRQKSTVI